MPKTLKYSLIIFISIILLLIIIPLNNYKGIIIDKVKEATNRDLTINGDNKKIILYLYYQIRHYHYQKLNYHQ